MSIEETRAVHAMLRARPQGGTVEERRARFEAMASGLWPGAPAPGEVVDAGGVPARWFGDQNADRAVIWFHGGAFLLGSSVSYGPFAAAIAEATGARVLVPDYRLVPEHPFPAAHDDALAAFVWLAGRMPADRVILGGDSAGANLALATAQARDGAGGLWLLSGWLDLAHTGASLAARAERDPFINPLWMPMGAAAFLSGAPTTDPRASPLYAPLAGLPPTLVQVGSDEVLFDDSRRVARGLEDAGVEVVFQEWVGQPHVWPLFAPRLEEGRWAIAQAGAWARRVVA